MIHIAKYDSEFGNIDILRAKATGAFVYRQDGYSQSECDQNGVSLAPYIHAIFGLLAQKRVADVLMIGGGGGSLATMLYRLGVRVTVVDINRTAFQIARRYFGLPLRVDCVVEDGAEFLKLRSHRYDAIVLDAYIGGQIPDNLQTDTFYRLAHSRMKNSCGCLVGNVYTRHDMDLLPDRLATKLNCVWNDVRLLDCRGTTDRNAIMIAGHVRDLVPPRLLMPPLIGADEIVEELQHLSFRPWHQPRQKPRNNKAIS